MEILGLDGREIAHSRMVEWLLDPQGSHGLGLRMLTALLHRSGRDDLAASLRPERVYAQRELVLQGSSEHADRRADIVVWADGTPVVIEMKVRAKETTDQTKDLVGHFGALHDAPHFVFLTLDGSDAEHPSFRPMRLADLASGLHDALEAAREPSGAAEAVGRRTAADYLESLGRLTSMHPSTRAAAGFWLRHGDDHAYDAAKSAAWTLIRELPERTARALDEGLGAVVEDLVVTLRKDEVQGSDKLRAERIVLLSQRRWMGERGTPRVGIGFGVRERRYPDDDKWIKENLPFYGIWISAPALREQDAVQLVEDPGLLPPLQAPPTGLPGTESQLQRQELPGYVVVQDVQDALQTQPVRHRPWARRLLRPGRQQRLDQRPQVVVHDPWPGARILPNGGSVTSVTPDQGTATRSSYELVGHGLIPQRSSA